MICKLCIQVCSRDFSSRPKVLDHVLEELPQFFPVTFSQACFAPTACKVTVGFPALELPGIDDLVPFGNDEALRKGRLTKSGCGQFQCRNDVLSLRNARLYEVNSIQALCHRIQRMHLNALQHAGLVPRESP